MMWKVRMCLAVSWVVLCTNAVVAQSNQLLINRVTLMPDMPTPYLMRDWKDVAIHYDSFIYDLSATGQYLPLMHLKSSGINYPSLKPILLDSYVGAPGGGSAGGAEAESINIIPSLVGASLVGIDKSNQQGINWVEKAKDFFNKANGQNVYLNGYSSSTGSDWWYDLMPNVFFYQLYSQYPSTSDFDDQFTTVADRELQVVNALGGSTAPWALPNMNHHAFNLSTLQPTGGVPEPEAAGTIAWILYHAYVKTGNKKYLDGAQLAITFLSGFSADPAYEIELPYGTFIAAKMNAELGTTFNISKMVNWSFDQSSERNWGTIVGTWGDGTTGPTSVSGLVGEVDNPSTGYAFTMNGFEQASALVPMVKYDKRFAHDVAKWTLNVANASRLFYSKYLPSSHQDDFAWTSVNDPNSYIAYEALKQTNNNNTKNPGTLLYATGDAERNQWAATNLGLYGSSHVGYLGAIVNTTDVDGILLLDVNKTDFFGQNAFPSFLFFNPYTVAKQVTVPLGAGSFDIYDAISETTIKTSVSGAVLIDLPASGVRLLSYLPAGTVTAPLNGKLMAGAKVVDYSYGYNFNGQLRIRSLAAQDTAVTFNQSVKVYSTVEDKSGPVTFSWYLNGTLLASSPDSTLTWSVPSQPGPAWIVLSITDGVSTVKDSLEFNVFSQLPVTPVVTGISSDSIFYYAGKTATLVCHAKGSLTGGFSYIWDVGSVGTVISEKDSVLTWAVPATEALYGVSCKVTNGLGLSASAIGTVLVKVPSAGVTGPVAYYSFDGDTKDHSGNGHDATLSGAVPTTDSRGQPNDAYLFSVGTDIIEVPNATSLNFQQQITLSFWVKLSEWYEESFILSHGSYEERWKVSVITGNYLRWTIKTQTATVDLDSSFPLQLNTFYHCAVVYTGYSMEIYINGLLNRYNATTGLMDTADKDITFGRKDPSTTQYDLHGTLDEVRIYNKSLEPDEIGTLKSLFSAATTPVTGLEPPLLIGVYPNPSSGEFLISGVEPSGSIALMDMTGRPVSTVQSFENGRVRIRYSVGVAGVLLLKIETRSGVQWKKIIAY